MKFTETPPKRLVNTKNIDKKEWLEWRRKGVTGTDVAAIFGMNQYKSAYQCYQDKLGLLPEIEDNNRMRLGRDMEDIVAQWFSEETGFKVENRHAIYQHSKYKWMLANIDRWIVGEKAVLECKTAMYMFQKEKWGETGSDQVPDDYLFQVYHYMIVFGVRKAYLAVIFTDTKEFRHYEFNLNESLAETIINKTNDFFNGNVAMRIEPDLTTMEDVVAKYPLDSKGALVADRGALELCKKHETLRQKAKSIENEMDILKIEIGKVIGEHKDLLVDAQGKALASFVKPKPRISVDTNKLKSLAPEVFERFKRESKPERSVTLKWQTLKKLVGEDHE